MSNLYKLIVSFLIGLFIFGLGIGVGYGLTRYFEYGTLPLQADTAAPENFGLFKEVWAIVNDKFYGGVPDSPKITYGAIQGALASLEDPYTLFVEPQPRELEKAALEGQFGGVGAYVSRDEAGQVILEPMPDSPSERAGLKKGDVLIQVDDTPLKPEMTTDDIILLIRGEVGTKVNLVVTRAGQPEPLTLTVERAIIETPSVLWQIAEEDPTVGYVSIRIFSNRTSAELGRAMAELKSAGATRYILDLRANGGGLLESAIDVASMFLADGVVVTENRRDEDPKVYKVRSGQKYTDAPIVILVDGGTASASEIVAGALRDHQRAILIGERTYGKGSVQLVYDLSDQSSLHVTVAKWFTPNNSSIDKVGLSPDIEALFTDEDRANGVDPQYLKALEYLQKEK